MSDFHNSFFPPHFHSLSLFPTTLSIKKWLFLEGGAEHTAFGEREYIGFERKWDIKDNLKYYWPTQRQAKDSFTEKGGALLEMQVREVRRNSEI